MTLQECFEQLPETRGVPRGAATSSSHCLMGTILAMACGATSYRKVHGFLATHWRRVIAVFGGSWKRAPAYTTVRHVLHELDPAALEAAFRAHRHALLVAHGEGAGRCMAIDGKVPRGRFDFPQSVP